MMATKDNVAFHVMFITSTTSLNPTTPTIKARIAPPQADQPIFNSLGCHITKTSVAKKIIDANNYRCQCSYFH